eukprot:PhF_6_TR13565/c0_g1_i1/m.21687
MFSPKKVVATTSSTVDNSNKGFDETKALATLYELQDEVVAYRKLLAEKKVTQSKERDITNASTTLIENLKAENHRLQEELSHALSTLKQKDKELQTRIKRVDVAVRSEVSKKEKVVAETLADSLQEVKQKAAEREQKLKAELERMRTCLQEERAKSEKLEAALRATQARNETSITPSAQHSIRTVQTVDTLGHRHTPLRSSSLTTQNHSNNPHPRQSGIASPRPKSGVQNVSHVPRSAPLPKDKEEETKFQNGDIKRVNSSDGFTSYWFASSRTLVTTWKDGTKVLEFQDLGQREVHHPDGSREVTTKDGETVRFTSDSFQ